MPWQSEAMKDVLICEKYRLADKKRFNPVISEWGNPMNINSSFLFEYIE